MKKTSRALRLASALLAAAKAVRDKAPLAAAACDGVAWALTQNLTDAGASMRRQGIAIVPTLIDQLAPISKERIELEVALEEYIRENATKAKEAGA